MMCISDISQYCEYLFILFLYLPDIEIHNVIPNGYAFWSVAV